MIDPQQTFKLCDELSETTFKDFKFTSWEAGLNSTERRNISRVKKVLDHLDELNRLNLKRGEELFYFCSQLIKGLLKRQYDIKCSGNTYSIKRLKG